MSNKALRILIADEQHFQRMRIERLFNQLNYYRVAPVHCLEELLTLVEYGCEPFDLVVINAAMASDALNLVDFFRDNAQVRHTFIYDGHRAKLPPVRASEQQKIQVSPSSLPDLAAISRLMALVDRRLPSVGTVISVR